MRNLSRALLAGGLGFAVSLLIAACGGGAGLLSGNQASTLNNQLSQISADITAGHCAAAQSAAQRLLHLVATLPSSVSVRLRQDLSLGASTISQLTPRQCHQVSSQTPPPQTTPTTMSTPTTTGTTTTTSTAPTTPSTPTTRSTTTTTSTTPTPPSGGGGLGGGSGSGGSGTGSGSSGSGSGSGSGSSGSSGGSGSGTHAPAAGATRDSSPSATRNTAAGAARDSSSSVGPAAGATPAGGQGAAGG